MLKLKANKTKGALQNCENTSSKAKDLLVDNKNKKGN